MTYVNPKRLFEEVSEGDVCSFGWQQNLFGEDAEMEVAA